MVQGPIEIAQSTLAKLTSQNADDAKELSEKLNKELATNAANTSSKLVRMYTRSFTCNPPFTCNLLLNLISWSDLNT